MKIVHVITGLPVGGAQTMLRYLTTRLEGFTIEVVSLTEVGPVGEDLRDLGVPVVALGMSRKLPNPLVAVQLAYRLRRDPPALVQTWLYHADLVGGVAAKLAGGIPCLWNIRHSDLPLPYSRRTTRWTAAACARVSRQLPWAIICNSVAAKEMHVELGYDASRFVIIPNGVDTQVYKPDPAARLSLRSELGLGESTPVIGLVGRFHPQKDHQSFIAAAAELLRDRREVHFVLCGEGVTPNNAELSNWIGRTGAPHHFHLLGVRHDVPRVTAGFDLAASSSSFGEAFSNVIIEAMACGVPCVATAVGDAAMIVGDTGRVVPPRQPATLAAAWRDLIDLPKERQRALSHAARQRIDENFDVATVTQAYARTYRQAIARYPAAFHA